MRNQAGQPGPAKRMRANSPQPAPMIPPPRRAAAPREVSPVATRMRERTPPPHLRPGQLPPNPTIVAAAAAAERADGSLHWFLGELPPVGRFDGQSRRPSINLEAKADPVLFSFVRLRRPHFPYRRPAGHDWQLGHRPRLPSSSGEDGRRDGRRGSDG